MKGFQNVCVCVCVCVCVLSRYFQMTLKLQPLVVNGSLVISLG